MKLARLWDGAQTVPIAVVPDEPQRYYDLRGLFDDISADALTPGSLARMRGAISAGDVSELRFHPRMQFLSPIAWPGKLVCVGLNYRKHAEEASMPLPEEPVLFLKASDTVTGPEGIIEIPRGSVSTDYEVELAVVIGSPTRYLHHSEHALSHVAGYTVANDVSERELQLRRGGQWDKGKNCEQFAPLGPWLLTADEIPDPQDLLLTSTVNGQLRQNSSTADMVFTVSELIRYISNCMPLYPGDVILTGTPAGVGAGFDPPRYLQPGDVVEVEVERIGRQRHQFVAGGDR